MRNNTFRKLLAFILITAFIIFPLAGCSKSNDEYGSISDAEINPEESPAPESPFTKLDNPFSNYTYRTVEYSNAHLSFEVPETWSETIVNPSCLRYDAPADDPHFPECTFYVKCAYDYWAVESDLDPFQHVASEFGDVMSPYITGLPYPYDGGSKTWIERYTAASETEKPDFSKDQSAASIKVARDVVLIDKVTATVTHLEGMDFVSGYFRWDGFPVMIATVVPGEWDDDAKAIIRYMISSAAYLSPKVADLTACEYRNLSFSLPADFEANNDEPNIFRSPFTDIKSTSGMSIGVFSVPESTDELTTDYIQDIYADAVAELLLDPHEADDYYPAVSCFEYGGGSVLDEKASFASTVSLTTDLYDYTGATRPYGLSTELMMDMFVIERGGENYMIAALYSRQQEEIATRIVKAAMQSFSVN